MSSWTPDMIREPFYPIEATLTVDEERTIIVPAFSVVCNGVQQVLTWANTTIREFDDSTFDRVELAEDDGTKSGIFADEDLIQDFREHFYPVLFMPYVDEASYNWFVTMSMKQIEKELGLG